MVVHSKGDGAHLGIVCLCCLVFRNSLVCVPLPCPALSKLSRQLMPSSALGFVQTRLVPSSSPAYCGDAVVSVGDVMKAAGLKHGAFYAHFASKAKLVWPHTQPRRAVL